MSEWNDIKIRSNIKRTDYTRVYRRERSTISSTVSHGRAGPASVAPERPPIVVRLRLPNTSVMWSKFIGLWRGKPAIRFAACVFVLTIVATEALPVLKPLFAPKIYALGSEAAMLPQVSDTMAKHLVYKSQEGAFVFNEGYVPSPEYTVQQGKPRVIATAYEDPTKGVSVQDPVNNLTMTLKPNFALERGTQMANRVVYPLANGTGWLVYTMQSDQVKEDVLLRRAGGDKMVMTYDLGLGDSFEARLLKDGGIGVFGSELPINGQVATGSDKDVEMLQKLRDNSQKTKLFFRIPAPVIKEYGTHNSSVDAKFTLEKEGTLLVVTVTGLKRANYPLTIDPSVYVESAEQFMRGNNETNVDFDVPSSLIQKGVLTGATVNDWSTTMSMNSPVWNQGTAVSGGYVYSVGGSNGSANLATVSWAKFDSNDDSIISPDPGAGICSDWCANAEYNLPAPRSGLALVAYNGYLYAIGGNDASCTALNGTGDNGTCSTVYVAKLGANGEPQLWHPTSPDQGTWKYWNATTSMIVERKLGAAAAFNNRLYISGGQSATATGGITTVRYAEIGPNGALASWQTTTSLVNPRYGHGTIVYNGYLYVLGGNSNGVLRNTVRYNKINDDGTLGATWLLTSSFTTARQSWGGNFVASYGGYIYIAGGCVSTTSYCTSGNTAADIQLASINADGTLTSWASTLNMDQALFGYGLVAWRGALYAIGGCGGMSNVTTCSNTRSDVRYGTIDRDGNADNFSISKPYSSGTVSGNPCSGYAPGISLLSNCDTPIAGDGTGSANAGRLSSGVVVNNGYLYVIGGCATATGASSCSNMSGNTAYAALSSDGSLVAPSTCPTAQWYGTWCVDSTNQLNGTAGVGTMGTTVFNNTVYVVGGTSGSAWSSTVYRVGFNPDGSLEGSWIPQTFSSVGLGSAKGYSFVTSRANPTNANSAPGNLYVIGGCSGSGGVGCSTYYSQVYKCNITNDGSVTGCTTNGQLQIDSDPSTSGNQGLGLMAGFEYANYVYLIGGSSPSSPEHGEVRYAKIDNNNNIVAVNGSAWEISPNQLNTPRRRGFGFGYNGYIYAIGGYNPSAGILGDLQYAKINVSDGSISAFTPMSLQVTPRWDFRTIVSNGYVYIIGGCGTGAAPGSCSQTLGEVQTLRLYNNYSGAPAGYTNASGASLYGTDRMGAGAAILNGNIYIAGGCTSGANCTAVTDNVQFAPLGNDGSVGTWASTADATLPAARAHGKLLAAGGTLYYVGGQDAAGNPSANVYYGVPNATGNVTSWILATQGLPAARTEIGAAVWNNRLYVAGGRSSSSDSSQVSTVYYSPDLSAGGNITTPWATASNSLVTARSGQVTIAYAGNLYILGGYDGANYLNDVDIAKIDLNGNVGSWNYTTSLPRRVRQGDGFAANGYMYVFGGRSDDMTCTSNTYVAPVSANTAIAAGNNPTGLGSWYLTNSRFSGARYGVSAAYNEGKAYVLGGGCYAPGAPSTVMEDDFDPDTNSSQWNALGTLDANTQCASYSGNSLRFSGSNNTRRGVTNSLDVRYGGTVSFYVYAPSGSSGSCRAPSATEQLVLEYSTDTGVNWTVLSTYTAPMSPIGQVAVDIPADAQASNTRFRWRQTSSNSTTYDNWAIDNVVISAYGPPTFALITGSEKVAYTTLLSQPQLAHYSINIDTDSDVFPAKWLVNGLDNSTGARWNMDYQSSTQATAVWGKKTNYGNITLGSPASYVPLDGVGANTNFARYYFLSMRIDSSQAFGYPEDISRGPTITDFTLQYTSEPGKRLRHGGTFVGGVKQPLDTPF